MCADACRRLGEDGGACGVSLELGLSAASEVGRQIGDVGAGVGDAQRRVGGRGERLSELEVAPVGILLAGLREVP